MKVRIRWQGRVLVAVLTGEIDMVDSEGLGAGLEEVAQSDASGVVLDFAEVTYIASVGIGLLMQLARELRARGVRSRIAAANPAIEAILETVRIGSVLPVDTTVDEAVEKVGADGDRG